MRNHYLSQLAMDTPRLEFSKPGKHLIQFGKVAGHFFNQFAHLNGQGLETVAFALNAKFKCARLCTLYVELLENSE